MTDTQRRARRRGGGKEEGPDLLTISIAREECRTALSISVGKSVRVSQLQQKGVSFSPYVERPLAFSGPTVRRKEKEEFCKTEEKDEEIDWRRLT